MRFFSQFEDFTLGKCAQARRYARSAFVSRTLIFICTARKISVSRVIIYISINGGFTQSVKSRKQQESASLTRVHENETFKRPSLARDV